MKTLDLKAIIIFVIISLMNLVIFANGLEFRIKINQPFTSINVDDLENHQPVRTQSSATTVGKYDCYLKAMKAQYEIEELGYSKTVIEAYFNYRKISIEDAFVLLDNRNEQDFKASQYHSMSLENMELALQNVQREDFYYTVQIGVYSEKDVNLFFDFPKLIQETVTDKGYYRYTFGKFIAVNDVNDVLKMMQEFGFEDAEIIAFDNLERIPLASAMEKEKRRLDQSLTAINQ